MYDESELRQHLCLFARAFLHLTRVVQPSQKLECSKQEWPTNCVVVPLAPVAAQILATNQSKMRPYTASSPSATCHP
eukprot:1020149-Amphidinium_carterae.1